MAAGTCTVIGPYALNDTTTIATDLSTEAGAIVKNITPFQDTENKQIWFIVCTEA